MKMSNLGAGMACLGFIVIVAFALMVLSAFVGGPVTVR